MKFDELLFSYCAFFLEQLSENLQDSIQISEAPNKNSDVHFSLADTGHA